MDMKEKWASVSRHFKDWLLSKATGNSIEQIRYERWRITKYKPSGIKITDCLKFKYVICVDYKKWFNTANTRAWELSDEALPYMGLGKGIYLFERGVWLNGEFHINGLGDCDCVFVGTDSEEDAFMITLKFS
jgi:hypothetical protein